MTRMLRRLDEVLAHESTGPTVFWSAAPAVLLGALLVLEVGTPSVVALLGPPRPLGAGLVVIGVAQLVALTRGMAWLLMLTVALTGWAFGMLAAASLVRLGAPPGAIGTYIPLALMALWVFVRVWQKRP